MDAKFTNHDIVQNVLHKHLRDDVVLKSIYESRVSSVNTELKQIKHRLQVVESKVKGKKEKE